MVVKRQCSFCANEIEPGTGMMFVKRDGTIYHFCSSSCRKQQLHLGRVGHRRKWTRAHMMKRAASQAAAPVISPPEPAPVLASPTKSEPVAPAPPPAPESEGTTPAPSSKPAPTEAEAAAAPTAEPGAGSTEAPAQPVAKPRRRTAAPKAKEKAADSPASGSPPSS